MILLLRAFVLLLLLAAAPAEAVRLFTCGFEENDFTGTIWTNIAGTPTIQTTTVRSGTYAASITSGAARDFMRQLSAAVTSGTYFTRMYFRKAGNPSFNDRELFVEETTGGADSVRLRMDTNGQLELVNVVTGTVITGSILSNDTWYRIEIRHLLSDTVGELELRVDGTTQGTTITGEDTLSTEVQRFRFGSSGSDFGANTFWDDIAINDATGTFQTTWPGAGKIALIEPASDTSITWEDDDLVAAATFANINELPGTPDDVAFNTEVVTLNSIDRFGVGTLPAEVTSDADMILLDAYARVGGTVASTSPTTGRLIVWDEGGTSTNGPNVDFAVNGWRILSVGTTNEHQVFDLGTRSKTNVEAFSLGYENITDLATRPRRVSTLWANVEWIEAGAGAGGGGTTPLRTLLGVGQ